MWTSATSRGAVAAALLGLVLFVGGIIYALVNQSELEARSTTATTCLERQNLAIGGLECTTGPKDDLSTQAYGSRVLIGTGFMVSGAVLLGAGVVAGKRRYQWSQGAAGAGAPPQFLPPSR
ncbi:hypothetical protein [Nocardia sp. NPDC050717]|uniref:hypothetical protein n=1 Tax=Nocardia sp. NPDC050717 TaxID=3157221 RepID=UPI0033CB1DF8